MNGPPPQDSMVGLIGLGIMGSAISSLLLASGAQVWGYDVAEERNRQLAAAGGRPAASPAEVAAACPVVLTSLPSAAAFHDVVSGPHGLAPAGGASLVVEMSTLSLADKEQGRRALAATGKHLADAPLSGTGAQARTGDLVTFVSADRPADRERAIAVLKRFTRAQYDVGGFGNGSRFKYVANLLVAIHNVAAAEALVLAERAGLDLSLVLEAVAGGAGTSRMFEVRGPLIARRDYGSPSVRLEVFLKDIGLIGDFVAAAGAPTPLLAACRDLYERAMASGRSGQDSACVAEVLREQAHPQPPGMTPPGDQAPPGRRP